MGDFCLDGQLRCTRFRTVCPACGRMGVARWTHELNVAKCVGCGARFDPHLHTYRPVTGGMTEAERDEYYREMRRRLDHERWRDPEARARKQERDRVRYATEEFRAKHRERQRAYYYAHHEEEKAKRRVSGMTPEQRERKREHDRRYRESHRDAINYERNRRRLEAMRDDR